MFEIDYVGLLISAILILAFAAPIIIQIRKNNGIKKQFHQSFLQQAASNGLQIKEMDIWRNSYAIGLDHQSQKMAYLSLHQGENMEIIDLQKVAFVDITQKYHVAGSGKNSSKVLDKLVLTCQFRGNGKSPIALEFYDGDRYSDLQGEFPLIQKWLLLIKPFVPQHVEKQLDSATV